MMWIVLFMALGLVCLSVEILIPGGILGMIGGGFLLGATIVAFVTGGSEQGLWVLVGSLVFAGLAFWIEIKILPRTSWGKRAFLTSAIESTSAPLSPDAAALIGAHGKAVTMLSPTGIVLCAGKNYEAFSRTGQLAAGTDVVVVAADNFRLIVSPTPSHSEPPIASI